MIYGVVKIGSSGHSNSLIVTIPADIRADLGLQVGEKLLVSVDDMGRIIYERQKPLKIVSASTVSAHQGSADNLNEGGET